MQFRRSIIVLRLVAFALWKRLASSAFDSDQKVFWKGVACGSMVAFGLILSEVLLWLLLK